MSTDISNVHETDEMSSGSEHRARGPVRPSYLLVGSALTVSACVAAATWNTGVSSVLLWAVLPDLALLLAIGGTHRPGQLPRHAVPAYNLLHRPALPALLLVAASTPLLGDYWGVAAVSWLAHICFDRGSGYGLRTRDGWQRGESGSPSSFAAKPAR